MKRRFLLFALLACGILAGTLAHAMDRPAGALAATGRSFGDPVPRERTCGTPEPAALEAQSLHEAVQRYVKTMGIEAIQAVGGQIKVAFHVIYDGNNEGNVPQEQIDAQIAELNNATTATTAG